MILITESWCNEEISDSLLTIPGYNLNQELRVDRGDTAGGRGGGLLVYTKLGLKILSVDKVTTFNQYCSFMIDDVTVYLIYRSPSGGADSIEKLTSLVRSTRGATLLIGDFNLPEADWEGGRTGARSRDFM